MAQSTNVVTLVGRAAGTPEMGTEGDTAVADLELLLTEHRKVDDEWTYVEMPIGVSVWGKQGEACGERLREGSRVGVTGRLRRENGDVRVIASTVEFLGEPVAA